MKTVDERLTDPAFFADESFYDLLAQMRRDDPVHWTLGRNSARFWSLFKHADIKRVLGDAESFSSEREGMVPIMDEALREANMDAFKRGESIITTDPPRHGKLRELASAPFMPKALQDNAEHVAALIREIFDELPMDGEIDLVDDLAGKIPMVVICDILGIPRQDWGYLIKLGKMAISGSDPEYQREGAAETTAAGYRLLREYTLKLVMPRRGCPHADALSTLANGKIDGTPLSESELVEMGILLMLAGFETTRNAVAGGILALLQHPEQMNLLRQDHKLIRRAVEEIVRWTNPAITMMRVATSDAVRVARANAEISGKQIKEGDRLVLWFASANRDESVFERADQFDVTRSPNPHIGFGFGPHTCLGGPLAKLELRITLEELLKRYNGVESTGKPERSQANFVGGLKRFPVRLTA